MWKSFIFSNAQGKIADYCSCMNRDISFEDFVDFLSYSVAAHMLIIIHFLDGYALEEIQISTAETRILSCCTKLCL